MRKVLFLIKMFCISAVLILSGNAFAQMDDQYYYDECYHHGGCESSSSDSTTNSIVENVVQSDFDSTFTADATSVGQEAAAEGFDLMGFVMRYGIFKYGNLDVKSYSLPLSYTLQLDSGNKLKFKLPLSMVDVEGFKAYNYGFGMDYTFKVSDKWSLTPSLNYNVIDANDFNSDGQLASGLLTSNCMFELGKYQLHMGNMVGYYRSTSFSDDQYDPDISNTVLKNGLMMAIPTGNATSMELFVTDTRYFGNDLYIDQYNEFGFSFGFKKSKKDPDTSKMKKYFSYLRAGITYMYADGDNDGFSFNLGYSF